MRDEPQTIAGKLARAANAKARGRVRVAEVVKANHSLTWERDGWTFELERAPWDKTSERDNQRHAAVYDLRVTDGERVIFRDRVQCWDGSPVMAPDGTFDLEGNARFREDPVEAARIDLAHTVKVVTKDGKEPWVKEKPGTVSTFYAGTGDGFLQGTGATWAEARAGSSTININTALAYFTSGCDVPGAFWEANQGGFAFNTAAIPDTDEVSAATLSLYVNVDLSDVDSTHEVRAVAFGTLTTADFIAGASLSGITRIASIATSGLSASAYNDFTEDGTGLRDAISLTGLTELWLTDSVQLSATNPSGRSMVRWSSANEAGTTQDPKLVVTHAPAAVNATITGTVATATAAGVAGTVAAVRNASISGAVATATTAGVTATVAAIEVTRMYFSSTATPAVSPAFAAWSRTTEADRRTFSPTKDGSALSNKTIWANGTVSANASALARQFVSDPLVAGIDFTTSTAIRGVVRVLESGTNDNINRTPICLKVYSQDGTTLRATLKALGHYGPTTTEWDTGTAESRRFADGDVLDGNYTTVAGDRLVLEIGGQVSGSGGTSVTGTLIFGSAAGTDLDESETDTGADNPWFSISVALDFLEIVTVTGAQATATAAGVAGLVTAVSSATVTGEIATATAAALDGTVAAQVQATITGEPAEATAAGTAGTVTAVRTATITGEIATASAAGLAGAAQVARTVTGESAEADAAAIAGTVLIARSIPGELAEATAEGVAGTVASVRIATVTGTVASATSTAIPGAVEVFAEATITGEVAAATSAALPGSVSVARTVTGEIAAASAEGLAGVAAAQVTATIAGEPAEATAAGVAGTVTTVRVATITGAVAEATAAALPGAFTGGAVVAITGAVAEAEAAGIAGTVAAVRIVSITGTVAGADAAAIGGVLSAIRIVTITGAVAQSDAESVAATVAAIRISTVVGAVALANAAGIAGAATAIRIAAIAAAIAQAQAAALAGSRSESGTPRIVTLDGSYTPSSELAGSVPSQSLAGSLETVALTGSQTSPALTGSHTPAQTLKGSVS